MAALGRLLLALALAAATAPFPVWAGERQERSTVPDRLAREAGLSVTRIVGPAEHFSRHCQGCHGHHGVSVSEVPTLKGRVGWFVHTAEGRAYLPRVPGVAFAHLSDADLAAVLNWALLTYSADELPDDFKPYTGEEVGTLRRSPVDDISGERGRVIQGLVAAGVIGDAAALDFGADRRY